MGCTSDATKTSEFKDVDKLCIEIFNLLKNSGKIKSEIKAAAHALNTKHYVLAKVTGTRFVGHRRKAYGRLLQMWPALITAI